jgi:phosphoribosylglycinamide formyltransferase-1
MFRLAVFASGSGSNAAQLMAYFAHHPTIRVVLVVCNRREAGVYAHAEQSGVPAVHVPKSEMTQNGLLHTVLHQNAVSHIALAGFLLLVPNWLTKSYTDKIFNIHPALLPKFGGRGMYGHHVHEAVKAAGEQESGCTIHLVTENYDEGRVLYQAKVPVDPTDTAADIATKVLAQEHRCYARVVEAYLTGQSMIF